MFPCSVTRTKDEVEHKLCISYHGEFLSVLHSNFAIFRSTRRSPTLEQRGAITALYLVTIDIDNLGVVDKYIYLLIFYKYIQGSSDAMQSCMFLSTVDASLGQSTFIIIRLSVRTFSRSIGESDAPYICLLPILERSDFCPLLFIFTRFISTPWIFNFSGLSALSDLGINLRALLRS